MAHIIWVGDNCLMLVTDLTIFVTNVLYLWVFPYANKTEKLFRKWPWQILGYLWKFISPCFIIFIMVYYVGAWTGMVVPRTRTVTFLHGRLTSVTALKRNIIWFLSIFNLGWASWICNGIFKEMFRKTSDGQKFWLKILNSQKVWYGFLVILLQN